jgi:hypothetical protein
LADVSGQFQVVLHRLIFWLLAVAVAVDMTLVGVAVAVAMRN